MYDIVTLIEKAQTMREKKIYISLEFWPFGRNNIYIPSRGFIPFKTREELVNTLIAYINKCKILFRKF